MNDRLRAARTSIRDASRGMKRVEDRVEHGDAGGGNTAVRECPCVEGHRAAFWRYPVKFLWDSRLKEQRNGSRQRVLGGLTPLSILLLTLLLWWIAEEIASEIYCQHPYANFSRHEFSVNPNAPVYPFVLPTLFYRNFIRVWWEPSSSVAGWMWRNTFGVETSVGVQQSATITAAAWSEGVRESVGKRVVEEVVWDQSMLHDEVVR
jgi:hypothetical protein